METDEAARLSPRADPSTILGKFLVGYQGWCSCPDEREASRSSCKETFGFLQPRISSHTASPFYLSNKTSAAWKHWFSKDPNDGGHPIFDFWPDVSEYPDSELHIVPSIDASRYRTGASNKLFSSYNPSTVARHFRQLAAHRIDGVFFQRWGNQCLVPEAVSGRAINPESLTFNIASERDSVLRAVRHAAEASERTWAIMYDLTAMDPGFIPGTILADWDTLVNTERILESTSYLHQNGWPVLGLCGVGIVGSGQQPAMIRWLISELRKRTRQGLYIVLGVSTNWRTADGNQDLAPGWSYTLLTADALCPWTVRQYGDEGTFEDYSRRVVEQDMQRAKERNVAHALTVFPGFSMGNATQSDGHNEIARQGGKFLWKQLHEAQRLNAPFIYGAMFDEFESGLALMPIVPKAEDLPRSSTHKLLALDVDGITDLPSDWYLRLCGAASVAMKTGAVLPEDLPRKMLLVDYWHSRPTRSESADGQTSGASSSGARPSGSTSHPTSSGSRPARTSAHETAAAQALAAVPDRADDDAPPPPYSLTVEEEEDTPVQGHFTPTPTVSNPVHQPIVTHSSSASLSSDSDSDRPGSDYLNRLTSTMGSVSLTEGEASASFASSSTSNYGPQSMVEVTGGTSLAGDATNWGVGSGSSSLPHPVHSQTLPTQPAPSWPQVAIPQFGPAATAPALPDNLNENRYSQMHDPASHLPHHANTLPAHSSVGVQPLPSWGNAYPTASVPPDMAPARPSFPGGEAASYYSNHPALSPPNSPPVGALFQPTVPHHANSWGPGATAGTAAGWGGGMNTNGPAPPPVGSSYDPYPSHPAGTAYTGSGAEYTYGGPHHAYTIGPGVQASSNAGPWSQDGGMGYGPNQFSPPLSSTGFAAVQSSPPALPPRPSFSSSSSSSYSAASQGPTILPQAGIKILTSLTSEQTAKRAENALKMGSNYLNKFSKR